MYTIMPSYSYFVVKRLIGSLVFMVTFAVIMLVFKNYRFSWVIPIFLSSKTPAIKLKIHPSQ